MTRDQESFFAMALKVKNFNLKNMDSMTAVPAVIGFFEKLSALINELISADAGSRADLTGYALAKSVKRTNLEILCLKVSNALASYSVVIENVVLQKRADFPASKWYLCSEEELVTQASIVKNLAKPIADELAPYGIDPVEVAKLDAAIEVFTTVISDPTLAIDQRKDDNLKVIQTIDDIRTLLSDKLDVLMRSFEVNNPKIYDLYRSARAIDANGSSQSPTAEVDVLAASIKTVYTASGYDATTFYTIQNKGKDSVTFSLSNTTDTEGTETVLLNAGETRSRLAENLAPSGVYLVVNNPNAGSIKIRVWVE
jgi:hypothetical protein